MKLGEQVVLGTDPTQAQQRGVSDQIGDGTAQRPPRGTFFFRRYCRHGCARSITARQGLYSAQPYFVRARREARILRITTGMEQACVSAPRHNALVFSRLPVL